MGRTAAYAFVDGLALILLIFLIMPHNPSQSQQASGCGANGLIVEISWPGEWHTDVDLHIKAPGDSVVFYGRSDGQTVNLLRDDLGFPNDLSKINYELACSRGVLDGEYIFNVHLYRNQEKKFPVPVGVVIRHKRGNSNSVVFEKSISLNHINHEITAVRLTFNDGKVVGRSNIQRKLTRNGR